MTAPRSVEPPAEPPVPALSPAARALLEEIRDREGEHAYDPLHLGEANDRGLSAVLRELAGAGEVLELERGHLISIPTYRRRRAMLRRMPPGFHSREAASVWGCSHGRARAVLARMVRDGLVRRVDGRFRLAEDQHEI